MAPVNGGSGTAPSRSRTSVWVSSSSKIRSDAAIACCRLALTRDSFLIGPYINSKAARNDVNSPAESRPFPWPRRTVDLATALTIYTPEQALARSVSLEPVQSLASLERADELGLIRIAQGAVSPADCDLFGRMRPELFIGRV